MKIIFRTDGSNKVGIGHIMRCLALAQGFVSKGIGCIFVMKDSDDNIVRLVKRKVAVVKISADCGIEDEMATIKKIVHKYKGKMIVADSYAFDQSYLKRLRVAGTKLFCIDDLADRRLPCDIMLNQNTFATKKLYKGKIPAEASLLLGLKYALLRKEFIRTGRKSPVKKKVKNILITMGGGDSQDQTIRTLKAMINNKHKFSGIKIAVVVGSAYKYGHRLSKVVKSANGMRIEISKNISNMAEVLSKTDLVVSAAGSTCWELCCLGVPGLIFVMADNQKRTAEELGKKGVFVNLGWWEDVKENDIIKNVEKLISSPLIRAEMSKKGMALVDGKGIERVVDRARAAIRSM